MQLIIGYDNFGSIVENNLNFVDKTLFIKEIIDDDSSQIILITRPRRFGKTLNLTMLQYFFAAEVIGKSTRGIFDNLKIAQAGEHYMQQQGQYPVIFLTLKDVKHQHYEVAYQNLYMVMRDVYLQHHYLLDSPKLTDTHKAVFSAMFADEIKAAVVIDSLKHLSYCLYLHHGVKPWLLIDEYDSPIHASYVHGYYNEIINLLRDFFSTTLKTNPYLHRAVITGILRVAKESLFSGLNNLAVYSPLCAEYSEHFGFTEAEVNDLLRSENLDKQAPEIQRWYNGYQIGNTILYNPWSIANCLKQKGMLQPYWVNTSDNALIKDLLLASSTDFKSQFELLLSGQPIEKLIDENIVFGDLKKNETAVWSLLLMTGYLKVIAQQRTERGLLLCRLATPNQEIHSLYRQIIEQWLSNGHGVEWYDKFLQYLLNGDVEKFTTALEEVMLRIVSVHDVAKQPEAFYHGLFLGFTVSLDAKHYLLKSNREAGLGRYDIAILPKDPEKLGILIECKAARAKDKLETIAKQALTQINTQQYTAELQHYNINRLLKIGIAFRGKKLKVSAVIHK